MDNDKLLREIGATLGTLAGKIDTALAGVSDDRLKCNSGSCPHYAGSGRCTVTDKCVLATVGGDACRERCINNKCEFRDDDDTCLGLTVCVDQIAPDAPDAPAEELLQGYTLAQWDEIRKGGYLCQFSNDGEVWTKGARRLGAVDPKSTQSNFAEGRDTTSWRYCRPAQIPGVLRPWFGGDCPVDPEAVVLIKMRDGAAEVVKGASYIIWGHNGAMDAKSEIIAYMEV